MDSKIKVLVADNDKTVTEGIINSIKDLEYIEIVGTAIDGTDTYNKIVELKPEMVFSKYNYNDITGLELIKRAKQTMKADFPIFSTIGEIPDNEIMEVLRITENKIKGQVNPPDYEIAKHIVEIHKDNR